ncbi:unnamed protein product [Ceratitis capitata]|uniref:(Mediterranean fruit fly) hypothetical protein n=1 Tax=Ceratitis capitata TaxID=7213 RepID=A0A811TYV5_CERCA|nr:unnamed protein product [Ceratitis capitata]
MERSTRKKHKNVQKHECHEQQRMAGDERHQCKIEEVNAKDIWENEQMKFGKESKNSNLGSHNAPNAFPSRVVNCSGRWHCSLDGYLQRRMASYITRSGTRAHMGGHKSLAHRKVSVMQWQRLKVVELCKRLLPPFQHHTSHWRHEHGYADDKRYCICINVQRQAWRTVGCQILSKSCQVAVASTASNVRTHTASREYANNNNGGIL